MVNRANQIPSANRLFYGWIIVIASFVILFSFVFMSNSTGVFFKPMLNEMGWSRGITAGAFSLGTLVAGLAAPFIGVLADKYGPRVMMISSAVFLSAGYVLASKACNILQLYLGVGLLMGLGSGLMWTPVAAMAARWFVARRGIALSLIQAGAGAGTIVGPPIATFITYQLDWRSAFLILGLTMAFLTLVAGQFLRRSPQEMGLLPDGVKLKPISETKTESKPAPKSTTVADAMKQGAFWKVFWAHTLASFAQQVIVVHLIAAATDREITPALAATFLSVQGVTNIIGKISMGFISDRIGRRISLTISLSLASLALFWLSVATEPWMFYVFAVFWGFSYGSWIPMFPAITGDLFGVTSLGGIFGWVTLGNAVGGAAGAFLAGVIFDNVQSYTIVFILSASLLIVGVYLMLAIKDPKRARQQPV
ncbi:MAG: proP [Dehalococcoidia bacterium]|nr:proP [Dehalococcoidia bacterium]